MTNVLPESALEAADVPTRRFVPADTLFRQAMANIRRRPLSQITEIWRTVLNIEEVDPDENFFDLGGDEQALLCLQQQVAEFTGYSFKTEIFATRPTLRGLTEQLGIAFADPDASPDSIDRLTFRLVRRATGASKGVVLSMPGLDGHAVGGSYARSGILADHDLWACEARLEHATAFNPRIWPSLAREIADRIQRNTAPRPAVLIGYSMAGYIAWLVARMLVGTEHETDKVIALDTPPMHWTKRDQSPALTKLLADLSSLRTAMLDIRRAAPGPFVPAENLFSAWRKTDGPLVSVPVATLDHEDMIRPYLLSRMARIMNSYVAEGAVAIAASERVEQVETFGGEVFSMLRPDFQPPLDRLSALLADTDRFEGRNAMSSLLYLAIAHAPAKETKPLCGAIKLRHPRSVPVHYACALVMWAMDHTAGPTSGPAGSDGGVLPGTRIPSLGVYDRALKLRMGNRLPSKAQRCKILAKAVHEAWMCNSLSFHVLLDLLRARLARSRLSLRRPKSTGLGH